MPVTIDVLDVNDNAPQFGKRSYSTVIPENMAVGSSVLAVTASDPDEGAGAEVSYELVDQGEASGEWIPRLLCCPSPPHHSRHSLYTYGGRASWDNLIARIATTTVTRHLPIPRL